MKSMRIVSIMVIVSLVAGLGFLAYEKLWGPDRLQLSGKGLPELLKDADLRQFLMIAGVLILFGVLEVFSLHNEAPVGKNGVTAQARVLKIWDTGSTTNDDPWVGLLLQVSPPDGAPAFEAKGKALVSRLEVALVKPGITAEVKYDPQKPQRLQVLALQIPDAAPSGTAARLEQLDALRDKDLISEEEYRQKKEEILKTR